MPRLQILSKEEINNFDLPPKFNTIQRRQCFSTDFKIDKMLDKLGTPNNKVGFMLLYGYFKVSRKFITADKFYDEDVNHVLKVLNIEKDQINFKKYMEKGYQRHKRIIADMFGCTLFKNLDKKLLENEIDFLVAIQTRPRQIFSKIIELLKLQRIEIPTYFILAKFIINKFNSYEKKLLLQFKDLVDDKNKKLLDDLIKIPKPYYNKGKEDEENQELSTLSKYKLTLLKKPSHSAKPSKIKENIDDFTVIKNLYQQIKPLIDELDLPVKSIRYYALWATKANVTQLAQFNNPYKRYLYLISFIAHQYYFRQDLFVDMLLSTVQSTKNTVKKLEKEQYFDSKKDRSKAIKAMRESHKSLKVIISEIKAVLKSNVLSSNEKVEKAKELLELSKSTDFPDDLLSLIEAETSKTKDRNYYNLLESRSIKLQNRVNPIVKCLEFNDDISDKRVINAINNYKLKDGNIDKKSPIDFLTDDEQAIIYNDKGRFRISLYKSLLFIHIANSLRSGKISLKHSYRYLSIEEYLIDLENWDKNKAELLKKAGLEEFVNCDEVLKLLKKALYQQYCITNDNILNGNNQNTKFNKDGKVMVITPKVEKEDTVSATSLFPKNQPYPILQILADVDKATNFISCFEHHNIKNAKQRPGVETFFGGIMGYGFDIGTKRIAQISKGINSNTLENTINWYFTLDSLYAVNNLFAQHINNLGLSNMFLRQQGKLHTASDGQKFNVIVDSLNSNYSFKYHGKEKGVSVYSFNDEKGRSYYNTAFSSAEREAPFVIDGLMHNDEIRSDIHSTDTHGFTETIFAASHMLGIFFAPRIKNLKKQQLYSFKEHKIKSYREKDYKILPDEYIDEKLIKENWDNILRLIATIKLKHCSASQIFKRLSSYAKQNPLYKALKEFGRINKSLFILKYYDELDLRQAIEKQLNLIELSHKFAKAIFFGNNQEFQVESKEEQEIIVNCRRLIQNAIILWNYMYLTKMLVECKDQKKRQEMLEIIINGSIIAWWHINLHGEYDFVKNDFKASNFDLEELLKFEVW